MTWQALQPWWDPFVPWLWTLGAVSTVIAVIGTLLVPWWLIRMPPDALVRDRSAGLVSRLFRFGVGGLLVLAGVAMLVLPGQGLLTIALGLWLIDVPIVRRFAVSALRHRAVRPVIDRWRARAGEPPLCWEADPGVDQGPV